MRWPRAAACGAALLAGAALGPCAASAEEERHGMMIDAGSEGSRLVIFKWAVENVVGWPNGNFVEPTAIGNVSTVPGIGSFALLPGSAGESLRPLVDYAKQQLGHISQEWSAMPIWLRATAGMRLLHAAEREAVLESVRTFLHSTGFFFRDEMAMVITGEEEGVLGWIAVNYKMGTFKNDELTAANSIGALDLGGASTQIVFIAEKSIMSQAFPLRLGRHRTRVYANSFLHFGQREAAHRAADVIISAALEQVQSVSTLRHPCFSMGYTYKPRFAYSDNRTFPMEVSMEGASDFLACQQLVQKIFMKDAPCLVQTCSFYGVYQPHVYDSNFVAFSHFAEVAANLALPKNARLMDMKIATEYVCSLSLEQLNVIFGRVDDTYARLHLCFHSTYVFTLLTYGMGFDPMTRQIEFKDRFANNEPIDYIVGAMIYEINQDPWLVQKSPAEQRAAKPTEKPPAPEGKPVLVLRA